jgi:hypothetical protein
VNRNKSSLLVYFRATRRRFVRFFPPLKKARSSIFNLTRAGICSVVEQSLKIVKMSNHLCASCSDMQVRSDMCAYALFTV